jgi:outer membrane protein OmpA-like peptidoglycan-associated protein
MESESNQSHWIPLADLMTGLMMVFMLLTAAFMLRVEQTTTLVVKEYEKSKSNLQQALQKEFKDDIKQWNADLLGDMTIRFNDPEVLFATGSSALTDKYKAVLSNFFPRYFKLLNSPEFKGVIKEIRIEGHTSAFWSASSTRQSAYFNNMKLSQDRTRSTLEYLLSTPELQKDSDWIIKKVTANGLSSSIPFEPLNVNSVKNQRVEFRIITNSDELMGEIAQKIRAGK